MSLPLTGNLINNINSRLTHFVCHMLYILYSQNKVSYKRENVIEKLGRERKDIYRTVLYLLKKKYLRISRPMPSKPTLLKGQLYISGL